MVAFIVRVTAEHKNHDLAVDQGLSSAHWLGVFGFHNVVCP